MLVILHLCFTDAFKVPRTDVFGKYLSMAHLWFHADDTQNDSLPIWTVCGDWHNNVLVVPS